MTQLKWVGVGLAFLGVGAGAAFWYWDESKSSSHSESAVDGQHGSKKENSGSHGESRNATAPRPHSEPEAEEPAAAPVKHQQEEHLGVPTEEHSEKPTVAHSDTPVGERQFVLRGRVQDESGNCEAFEFLTSNPKTAAPTDAEWSPVLQMYRRAKANLTLLAESMESELTPEVLIALKERLQAVRIYRPPVAEEPDLAYRGIGVSTRDGQGNPIIRLGPGFVELHQKHPERARFEMSRLLAQAWAPCEFTSPAKTPAFASVLKCLGFDQNFGCGPKNFSDAGWALSTVLANRIAPPGCMIPGLKSESIQACLKGTTL